MESSMMVPGGVAEGLPVPDRADGERELLMALLHALPDPVLVTDPAHTLLLENRRAEALFRSRPEDPPPWRRAVELNNLLFSSFLSRSPADADADAASRELTLVDPATGGDLLCEVLSTPLHRPGQPEALISVLRDVTELKRATNQLEHQYRRVRQAEQQSRRERDRLNLILEHVSDPILVTDEQGRVTLMNREAERLFDVPTATTPGAARRRRVGANLATFAGFITPFLEAEDPARAAALSLRDPAGGHEFPAEVVAGKILNPRGQLSAVVSIFHDLTKVVENERLAAELTRLNQGLEGRVRDATAQLAERNRQLEWQSQELQRSYQLKSDFLASMSHELRTPINALLGYTSLMRDRIYGELTPRQEEALQRMYSASQHLLELVSDVLDLAKIEAGRMPVQVDPVSLHELVDELVHTVEPMVRSRQLGLAVELAPEIPPLQTDRTKVKQILLNLLSNAVKFTHEGGITLRARPRPAPDGRPGVEVAVADTGIGIRPEDVDTIFEDFRQVDQSATREYGGTGLGLSITRKLLELLGGRITLESQPGQGSTFTVWLPQESQPVVPPAEPGPDGPRGGAPPAH